MSSPQNKPIDENGECGCSVHQIIRAWRTALVVDTPEKEAAFNDMLDAWESAETDLSYCRAILDGSWPTAVEQLTRALEKAKKIQEQKVFEQ